VIADTGLDTCRRRPALDHPVGVLLPKGVSGELEAGTDAYRAEERAFGILTDASSRHVLLEVSDAAGALNSLGRFELNQT
jgi:hypothetical protein